MDAQRVHQQLDRILASSAFADSERASSFLRFIVERKLEGRDGEIKESVIAVEVSSRPASFDSKSDPIVRVEAGRLRERLTAYYEAHGALVPRVFDLVEGGVRKLVRLPAAIIGLDGRDIKRIASSRRTSKLSWVTSAYLAKALK